MRWVPWLLGIAGVAQYGVIAYLQPTDYVSTDMAYLVMWGALVGALALTYLGSCCCGDGCGCCGEGCSCGDCPECAPKGNGGGHDHPGHGEPGHVH